MFHAAGSTERFPVFFKGSVFLNGFLALPGGITEYAASFLAQLFYFSSAGAAVVTIIALLFCLSTDFIVRSFNAPALRSLRFVLPILLLVVYAQYNQHIILSVALTLALLFVCFHIYITKKCNSFYAILLIESVLLYYLTGGAFLVFALLCAFYEINVNKKNSRAIISLLAAVTIPYIIGTVILKVPIKHAFTRLTPFYWNAFDSDTRLSGYVVHTMYLLVPAVALLASLCRSSTNTDSRKTKAAPKNQRIKWFVQTLPLVVLSVVAILCFTDKQRKAAFELNYYSYHQMWPQVLDKAKENPGSDMSICYADMAMFKTGRLGYDLFKWHKSPDSIKAMFPKKEIYNYTFWSKSSVMLETGFISYAHHNMVKSLERCGRLPITLHQLALFHMIKDDIPSARIYLNALKKTLFHKDIAERYLTAIKEDQKLTNIEEVQRYRKMINEDKLMIFSKESPLRILQEQVERNQNRAAFEYMMGMHLINKRTDEVIRNIPHLKILGYKRIPRLYEEAIIIYESVTNKKVDMDGYKISNETLANYQKFKDITLRSARNRRSVSEEYEKALGDSYLVYVHRRHRR